MSAAVNFDRDLRWVSLDTSNIVVPLTSTLPSLNVGVTPLITNAGSLFYNATTSITFSSFQTRSVGCLVQGPDLTSGCVYRMIGFGMSSRFSEFLRFYSFVGVANPSNNSQLVIWTYLSSGTSEIYVDETINVSTLNPDLGVSDAPLVFGICVINYNGNFTNYLDSYQISVQRLATDPPAYQSAVR